jgi:ketosteroid isomerase-like protein
MKLISALLIISGVMVCSIAKGQSKKYKPDSQTLYDIVVRLDSIYFHAYNICDLEKQAAMYSDSLEFYHDKTGLMTSKSDLLDAIKKNICGKVTRELVKGSIEVYPIYGYGAVEMGMHKFHNNAEKKGTPSHAGKFVIIWENRNNEWKIKRVISLH